MKTRSPVLRAPLGVTCVGFFLVVACAENVTIGEHESPEPSLPSEAEPEASSDIDDGEQEDGEPESESASDTLDEESEEPEDSEEDAGSDEEPEADGGDVEESGDAG